MDRRLLKVLAAGFWRGWGIPVALACHAPPTGPGDAGSGAVTGTVDGLAFDTVGSAWRAGQPDDASTTVVYVFDRDIACDELASPGWDTRVADGTQALEIKLIGQDPGPYPVPASGRPSGGESTDNYTLTSTTATPNETSATAGTVTLDALIAESSATGSFDLTFPTGRLAGTFATGWCAAAREP